MVKVVDFDANREEALAALLELLVEAAFLGDGLDEFEQGVAVGSPGSI